MDPQEHDNGTNNDSKSLPTQNREPFTPSHIPPSNFDFGNKTNSSKEENEELSTLNPKNDVLKKSLEEKCEDEEEEVGDERSERSDYDVMRYSPPLVNKHLHKAAARRFSIGGMISHLEEGEGEEEEKMNLRSRKKPSRGSLDRFKGATKKVLNRLNSQYCCFVGDGNSSHNREDKVNL